MAALWRGYLRCLERAPLISKCATSATLIVAADVVAQKLIERRSEYDVARTARLGLFGLCCAGPGMHFWYGALQRVLPGTGLKVGMKRVLADQVCYAPVIVGTFFVSQGFLAGHSVQQVQDKLSREYVPTMKANYLLWPAAQLINFAFVPPPLRVLYASGVVFVWNTFLSVVNAREVPEEGDVVPVAVAGVDVVPVASEVLE